ALKPKVFETLVLLVRNAGHLLTKQELMSRLWPDAVVDETNLNRNVWLIRRALGGSGDSSEYIETVPRIGYRFVDDVRRIDADAAAVATPAAATAAVPQAPAPADATSPLEASDGGAVTRSSEETAASPRRRAPLLWIAAAAAVALVVIALVLRSRGAAGAPTPGSRPTISVLGFRNLSNHPDLDWIATALSEMVESELAPASRYRLMPVETAERLRRDLVLERPGSLSAESLARLRRAAAVDRIVGGSYASTGGSGSDSLLRIDVLVQDARSGETVASVTETGEASHLFDLVASLGSRLRLALREPDRTPPPGRAWETLPKDATALRLYSEGLSKLRGSETLAARDLLLDAVAAEPDFPLSHAALGRAYATLGYEEKARLELQQALARSRGLRRQEQLEIESAYRAANKEWDAAVSLCRELIHLAPEDLENGLRCAGIALNAPRRDDAAAFLEAMRRLPPPTGDDPRIDLLDSRLLVGPDPKAALRAAERGIAESRARGERAVEANALLDRAVAVQTLGRSEKEPVQQAMRIFHEIGDAGGEARAAHILGNIRFDESDADGARASFQHAVDVSDRIGYVQEKAAAVASLSRVASLRGDTAEAERLIVEASSIWRAIPDRRQLPWGLNALGSIRLGRGDLSGAETLHREALKMCRDNGDRGGYLHEGYSGLLAALAAQGRLGEASELGAEALRASRQIDDPSWISQHAAELGSLAFERARLADAEAMLSESLALRQKRGEYTVPESEVLIARLRLEEGKSDEALRLAQKAAGEFAAAGRKADQAGADAIAAEALLAAGRRDEAKKSADAARTLLDETASPDARVPVLLAGARVESALGRREAARGDVDAAAKLAQKIGWKGLILETRLAAAELEAAGRSTVNASSSLAADARAMGFERIATRADRLAVRRS
ncbi:MAG TPA: winged helix-turn-helix domain-containing protein, partial [Thermoanaerobaculia bacterium]|nr:winged helix-turn-helix domain-containing protein [Thermoanaerobaculia bacterium]